MKLQAERRDADLAEPRIYNIKCGLLLRYEQYLLAVCYGIGDHGCDRLGFTGSRRAVKHEAGAVLGPPDRIELRRVRRDRKVYRAVIGKG